MVSISFVNNSFYSNYYVEFNNNAVYKSKADIYNLSVFVILTAAIIISLLLILLTIAASKCDVYGIYIYYIVGFANGFFKSNVNKVFVVINIAALSFNNTVDIILLIE